MRSAGFVLVGGHSVRMGSDKARLPLPSGLLVETVARKVAGVAGTACLLGPAHRYHDLAFEIINDTRADCGPLAGIEAALQSNRSEWNLIVACDMPGIEESWLARLLQQAQSRACRCLISLDPSGTLHPLCGVWRQECLADVSAALNQRRLRVHDLVHSLQAETLVSPYPLANVNTPEDWRTWQLTH